MESSNTIVFLPNKFSIVDQIELVKAVTQYLAGDVKVLFDDDNKMDVLFSRLEQDGIPTRKSSSILESLQSVGTIESNSSLDLKLIVIAEIDENSTERNRSIIRCLILS
jgi:hypothetical protein